MRSVIHVEIFLPLSVPLDDTSLGLESDKYFNIVVK
jgi:hypothetical protein